LRSIGGTSGAPSWTTGSSGGRRPSDGPGWAAALVTCSLIDWFLSRSLADTASRRGDGETSG
jgi:hypothetical protein